MSSEIARSNGSVGTVLAERQHAASTGSLAPTTFAEMERMAQVISRGGLFPQFKSPEQVLSLMLLCQAKNLHPMQAVERYDIVQGRPAMKSMAMQAAFLEAGGRIEWHASNDEICDATFSHSAGGTIRIVWDRQRATVAGLAAKDTWRKHFGQMLRSRVVSEGVRAVLPGVVLGIYTPDETEDFVPAAKSQQQPYSGASTPTDLPKPTPPDYTKANPYLYENEISITLDQAMMAFALECDKWGLDCRDAEGKFSRPKVSRILADIIPNPSLRETAYWLRGAEGIELYMMRDDVSSQSAEPTPTPAPPSDAPTTQGGGDDDLTDPFAEKPAGAAAPAPPVTSDAADAADKDPRSVVEDARRRAEEAQRRAANGIAA